ncbi:hypothetical protein PVAND_016064 [Polypedilum vanderplanki]|uniref:Uncharacterized protein n=1 Tax=Polypedilum vanderplanki TaxID=319348 RepID=A0A9J6BER9_POLVA|nr:hypothetical protein PVAND_016064 [Polypedilum vanderplanki]
MDALSLVKNIPPWLDQSLFEKAIRSYENDQSAQVYSFDIQPATQPGENFASAVFRVSIKYSSKYTKSEKEISVIIKTQPVGIDEIPGAEFLKDTTIFRTEIAMYTGVLSQIQSLLESVGENDLMCPKLIYQTLTPKPVIILEDVS